MNPMEKNTPKSSEECKNSLENLSFDSASFTSIEKAIIDQSLREIEAGLGIPKAVVLKEAAQWVKEK